MQCCLLQNQDFRKSVIAANVWSFWQHWRNKTRSLKIKWLKDRRPQDFQKPIERMLTLFPSMLCWNIKKCTYSVKNRNRFCPSLISSLVSRSVKHFYSAGGRAGCTFLIMMNWGLLHTIYTSFPEHRVNVKRGVREEACQWIVHRLPPAKLMKNGKISKLATQDISPPLWISCPQFVMLMLKEGSTVIFSLIWDSAHNKMRSRI